MNVFGILAASGVLGNLPKDGGGHRSLSPNNTATSFVYHGSIDGITRDICDGNYKYSVSSSGIIKSENYPDSNNPNLSCTNQLDSQADGITFEFQSFMTENGHDFIFIRDSDGNAQPCFGDLQGTRVSVDSSRLPVSIYFESDSVAEESGFSIAVTADYDSANDFNNGPCGS